MGWADWEFLLSLGKATGKFFSGGGKRQVFPVGFFFSVMFVCSLHSSLCFFSKKGGFSKYFHLELVSG